MRKICLNFATQKKVKLKQHRFRHTRDFRKQIATEPDKSQWKCKET